MLVSLGFVRNHTEESSKEKNRKIEIWLGSLGNRISKGLQGMTSGLYGSYFIFVFLSFLAPNTPPSRAEGPFGAVRTREVPSGKG